MRTTYGTDFAITNAGGLRADLTCPVVDLVSDFCPAFTPPNFPITDGQVLTVLPFGNSVVTLDVGGDELKTMLENGVSAMPGISGRFAQVSGLCFTYDIDQAPGSRVTGAVFNPSGAFTARTLTPLLVRSTTDSAGCSILAGFRRGAVISLIVVDPASAVVDEIVAEWCSPNGGHLSPPGIKGSKHEHNTAQPLMGGGKISFTPNFMNSGFPMIAFNFDHPSMKIEPAGEPIFVASEGIWITPWQTDDDFPAFRNCPGYVGGSLP